MFLKSTSPSSPYKPVDCLSSLFDNKDNIWMPTSSQISAPSKLPMVTSKQLSIFVFFQGSLVFYNKNFLQCFIIRKSFSKILMYCWANRIALSNISSNIAGYNSVISNWINLHCDLFSIMTLCKFFHWFTWRSFSRFLFIFSKIDLLVFLISLLHGFIKQQGWADLKLSL